MRAPPLVRAQLGESLKAVAGKDFPEHWPGLLPAILQNLSSQVRMWAHALSLSIQNPHPCIPGLTPCLHCAYVAAFMGRTPLEGNGG